MGPECVAQISYILVSHGQKGYSVRADQSVLGSRTLSINLEAVVCQNSTVELWDHGNRLLKIIVLGVKLQNVVTRSGRIN